MCVVAEQRVEIVATEVSRLETCFLDGHSFGPGADAAAAAIAAGLADNRSIGGGTTAPAVSAVIPRACPAEVTPPSASFSEGQTGQRLAERMSGQGTSVGPVDAWEGRCTSSSWDPRGSVTDWEPESIRDADVWKMQVRYFSLNSCVGFAIMCWFAIMRWFAIM